MASKNAVAKPHRIETETQKTSPIVEGISPFCCLGGRFWWLV
jgi:hypothetical protein